MPVKVVVDTSAATPSEQQSFLTQHGATIQSIGAAATSHGYEFVYGSSNGIPPAPSQADVYKEMMQSLRYYGGVRYVLLPLYLTTMAVLVGAYYKGEYKVPNHIVAIAGFVASSAWLILEWGLSENLRAIWREVGKIVIDGKIFPSGIDPLPQRKRTANLAITRITFYATYAAGMLFWLCVVFDACRCALLSP